ncbi:MAG: beta-propeller fold lactonase family protein [Rhodocyclaceae bacterium]|nr:beta-propeller fold lactonase family protein [Rhodocyclaceae bacterium]
MSPLNSGIAIIATSLTLGFAPAWAAPTVYIPLGSGNMVIAVDAASSKITQTYTGVDNPHGLVATPDGEYLVAGSLTETQLPKGSSINTPNSKLFVIHPVHGHVMSTVPMIGWTHHQSITSDGRYVVSTHPTRGGISITDLTANKLIQTIATGPSPNYAVITPDDKTIYVTNTGNGTVSEIDTATWKVVRTLDAGASPEHMVLAPDGKRLFVSGDRSGKVSEVSIEAGKVVRDWELGKRLHGLDISDDGRWLFISVISEGKLVALDPLTGVRRVLPLAPAPYHLGTVHGTGKLYVSSRKEPKIWVVDQKSLTLLDTIQLPAGEGHEIAVVQ